MLSFILNSPHLSIFFLKEYVMINSSAHLRKAMSIIIVMGLTFAINYGISLTVVTGSDTASIIEGRSGSSAATTDTPRPTVL